MASLLNEMTKGMTSFSILTRLKNRAVKLSGLSDFDSAIEVLNNIESHHLNVQNIDEMNRIMNKINELERVELTNNSPQAIAKSILESTHKNHFLDRVISLQDTLYRFVKIRNVWLKEIGYSFEEYGFRDENDEKELLISKEIKSKLEFAIGSINQIDRQLDQLELLIHATNKIKYKDATLWHVYRWFYNPDECNPEENWIVGTEIAVDTFRKDLKQNPYKKPEWSSVPIFSTDSPYQAIAIAKLLCEYNEQSGEIVLLIYKQLEYLVGHWRYFRTFTAFTDDFDADGKPHVTPFDTSMKSITEAEEIETIIKLLIDLSLHSKEMPVAVVNSI